MEPTIFKPRLQFKPPLKFFKFGHWKLYFSYKSQPTQLNIFKPYYEIPFGSTKLSNQNLRQIGYVLTYKQRLLLYYCLKSSKPSNNNSKIIYSTLLWLWNVNEEREINPLLNISNLKYDLFVFKYYLFLGESLSPYQDSGRLLLLCLRSTWTLLRPC